MNSRLFVGINISHLLKDVITMTSSMIECEKKAIKWNTGTNLHITLSFIGNVDQAVIPDIINKIKSLYLTEPFKILRQGSISLKELNQICKIQK